MGILTLRGVHHLEKADLKPRGAMAVISKNCAKCGQDHSGEFRQGTNACFSCGKNRHMVKDYPQNRGQVEGNAQPRPNPEGAAASKPPNRNRFYALKDGEE